MVTTQMRVLLVFTILALVLGYWGLPAYQDNLSAKLCRAAMTGDTAQAEQALAWGANIESRKSDKYPPLFLAIRHHRVEIVKLLLAHGANTTPELEHNAGKTSALRYAAEVSDLPIFTVLSDRLQMSAEERLQLAVSAGSLPLANSLLTAGANPNTRDVYGKTALHYAADRKMLALLLAHGAQVNIADNTGLTPIFAMVHLQDAGAAARLLLDKGARVDLADHDGNTLLHAVAPYGANTALAALLLTHGAAVDARNHDGATPLHLSAEFSDTAEMVALLLAHGAAVDARDKDGNTPLHRLARRPTADEAVLKILFAHGAQLTARNKQKQTPLDVADKDGHDTMVAQLQKFGAGKK